MRPTVSVRAEAAHSAAPWSMDPCSESDQASALAVRNAGIATARHRLAWLLRVNRILGPDRTMRTGTRFAAALRSQATHHPASAAQVSRWETATATVDYSTLHNYEKLLGLPTHRLVAIAYLLGRGPAGSPPRLSAEPGRGLEPDGGVARLHALLEQALSAMPVSGVAWDELTARLSAYPQALLHPRTAWEELSARLLAELTTTTGAEWALRNQACFRLLRHPRGRADAVAACDAASSVHQIRLEPLSLLEHAEHPEAVRVLLRQLSAPTGERALCGAVTAAVGKMARHTVPRAVLPLLVDRLNAIVTPTACSVAVGGYVANVLRQATTSSASPALHRLRARAETASPGTAYAPAGADALANQLALAAMSRLDEAPTDADETLIAVLADLLFSPDLTVRLHAGMMIGASPYARPVADVLAGELAGGRTRADSAHVAAMVNGLAAMAVPVDHTPFQRLLLAREHPTPVHEAAARALGQIPGNSPESYWRAAVERHLRPPSDRPYAPTDAVAHRLIQAMATKGGHGLLPLIAADTRTPAHLRAVASWWNTAGVHRLPG
ncbi:hypothetical protein QLQ12_36430 [Actinoplanes sp. NEAU-A12]|uniref:HEAT repeat domain-containing protein n=1 Tax=Actinoplanes sandaracinus TaxID=3045177 RepID=A0ABT6WWH5_9ACTN|nr:hypothetical protein [Actinoplanes sandaracinus]MDI6104093.1 hypothetical protein [Actinoplanes sandaracinus]